MRKVAGILSLYCLMDGGKFLVGVAAATEEEQLSAQRQTQIWSPQHRKDKDVLERV